MRCCSPKSPILEYDIEDSNDLFFSKDNIKLPIIPETDIDLLKEKVICEYQKIITELERGNKLDLEFLLEEISAIILEDEIDNREFIIQYYLNNDRQILSR